MSRVINSLITGQAATDSAHVFASSLGGAQPTLAMRCGPAARPLARAGVTSVSIWSENLQKIPLGRNSDFFSPNGLENSRGQ